MITSHQVRVAFGTLLLLCGVSAAVAFGLWQRALAGLSPDGSITPHSWLILRLMLLSLIAPGIVILTPDRVSRIIARIQDRLQKLSVRYFLSYTLAVGVVLRVIVIVLMPLRLVSDFADYDELAMLLIKHGEYTDGTHPTAYFPPGWPFFLSLIYRVFGHNPEFGIVANVAFGVATVVLTWRVVQRVWGEMPARCAAILVAVIPCEVFFTNVLASEGLFTVLLMSSLLLLLPRSNSFWASLTSIFAGGLVLGLATLTRSLPAWLPVVFAGAAYAQFGKSWRSAALWLACVAGLVLVITPWILRNAEQLGRATLCTNTGTNLYVGNNPNSGVGFSNPDRNVLFLRSAADEVHDDSVGFAKAVEYIRERPFAFLVRGALKTVFFLTSDTDALAYDLTLAADSGDFNAHCWVALFMQACWMTFLVAVGMGVRRFLHTSPWRNAGGILLFGVILYWLVIHFVAYGSGRYHMPIVPAMAAFAGLALARLTERT